MAPPSLGPPVVSRGTVMVLVPVWPMRCAYLSTSVIDDPPSKPFDPELPARVFIRVGVK